jgi:formate C-acetyltransferase
VYPRADAAAISVETLKNLLLTYFEKGGSTVQFNIFSKETLLDAQKNPEKYGNLQVRVCGWNLRFVDLAPDEQQIFIDRAAGGDVC